MLTKEYDGITVGGNELQPERGVFIEFFNEDENGKRIDSVRVRLRPERGETLYSLLKNYLNK